MGWRLQNIDISCLQCPPSGSSSWNHAGHWLATARQQTLSALDPFSPPLSISSVSIWTPVSFACRPFLYHREADNCPKGRGKSLGDTERQSPGLKSHGKPGEQATCLGRQRMEVAKRDVSKKNIRNDKVPTPRLSKWLRAWGKENVSREYPVL